VTQGASGSDLRYPALSPVRITGHASLTKKALQRWLIAQLYDAAAVGGLWLIGLLLLRVPLAPIWALVGMLGQFVPLVGTTLALIGPVIAALIHSGFNGLLYVLILYAIIVMTDGFLLQPYFMRRSVSIPVWVSIIAPLILGTFLSVWGVILSVPLLAVIYTYRAHYKSLKAGECGSRGAPDR
jgi:predicted PurR-regulated permease PerM